MDPEFSLIGIIILLMLIIPNLIWLNNKPKDYDKYSKKQNKYLQIIALLGQIIVIPMLILNTNLDINLSSYKTILLIFVFVILILYEIAWTKYFKSNKTIKNMYQPFLGFQAPCSFFPVLILYIIALYGENPYLALTSIILGIAHAKMQINYQDEAIIRKKSGKRYIFESIMLLFITLIIIIYNSTLGKVYEPIGVEEYLESSETIKIVTNKDGIFFDGEVESKLLIFFPGANVKYESYTPLMYKLAEEGIDTYLLKLPFNLSIFASSMPDSVIEKYKYDTYYVGGHSLGGVTASSYANNHLDNIKGIVLLASYPNIKINDSLSLISIYGNKDGVLNIDNYKKNKSNWPTNSKEYIIEGGNHSGFAFYGLQDKDNEPNITSEEQINETVSILINEL